jgi:hypothetical protein
MKGDCFHQRQAARKAYQRSVRFPEPGRDRRLSSKRQHCDTNSLSLPHRPPSGISVYVKIETM